MARSCAQCGGNQRLRTFTATVHEWGAWADNDFEFVDFCRHCIPTLERCDFCGDAVGYHPDADDNYDAWPQLARTVCLNQDKDCWYTRYCQLSNNDEAGDALSRYIKQRNAESHQQQEAADDEDDDRYECHECGTHLREDVAFTWHKDDNDYCATCVAELVNA